MKDENKNLDFIVHTSSYPSGSRSKGVYTLHPTLREAAQRASTHFTLHTLHFILPFGKPPKGRLHTSYFILSPQMSWEIGGSNG